MALERLEADTTGDLVYTFTKPWSDGTTGVALSPPELLEKLTALVPLPRAHLLRYAGCLASHSKLRGAITPTPHQQGVEEPAAGTPARWLLAPTGPLGHPRISPTFHLLTCRHFHTSAGVWSRPQCPPQQPLLIARCC